MTSERPTEQLRALLEQVQQGTLDVESALGQLNRPATVQLDHTTVDLDRPRRTGSAEVIFGQNKTAAQITDITQAMLDAGQAVLATRLDADKLQALAQRFPQAALHPIANLATIQPARVDEPESAAPVTTRIAVVSAGTSDQSVAEEAALTAEFYGNPVQRIRDVGVAGIHRLFARLDEIRQARVVIVVAGMEGALPSVLGGLLDKPMIAVPTSVGYGASFGGLSALLGMLNSCASGISVVNIDNGFGAGVMAHRINQL